MYPAFKRDGKSLFGRKKEREKRNLPGWIVSLTNHLPQIIPF